MGIIRDMCFFFKKSAGMRSLLFILVVKSQENCGKEPGKPGGLFSRSLQEESLEGDIYTSFVCFRLYRIGFPISGLLTVLMICAFNRSFNGFVPDRSDRSFEGRPVCNGHPLCEGAPRVGTRSFRTPHPGDRRFPGPKIREKNPSDIPGSSCRPVSGPPRRSLRVHGQDVVIF